MSWFLWKEGTISTSICLRGPKSIGIGILAKGPIIYLYVLPVALLAPWWSLSLPISIRRWYGYSLLAVALSLAGALAWALPASWQGGHDYASAILFGQTTGRMIKSFFHQRPVYWYLAFLPFICFPWSCYRPIWKRFFLPPRHTASRFLASILVPSFILLSLVSGKQLPYLLPLLPVAAIQLGVGTLNMRQPRRIEYYVFCLVCAIISLTMAVLPFLPIHGKSAIFIGMLPVWLGIVPLFTALPFLVAHKERTRLTFKRIALASMLFFTTLHLSIAKPLHLDFDAPKIFEAMATVDKQHKLIHIYPQSFKDQFQFAARLSASVVLLTVTDSSSNSLETKPEDAVVWYIERNNLPPLPEQTSVEVYTSGFLLFNPGKKKSVDEILTAK